MWANRAREFTGTFCPAGRLRTAQRLFASGTGIARLFHDWKFWRDFIARRLDLSLPRRAWRAHCRASGKVRTGAADGASVETFLEVTARQLRDQRACNKADWSRLFL